MNRLFKEDKIREAKYAGQFYPGEKEELQKQLFELFQYAEKVSEKSKNSNPPQALIVPHAGYIFSGQVAAAAYNKIPENAGYKRVFVLASSHRYSFEGAAVYTSGNYKTPLGEIEVDTQFSKELAEKSELFFENNATHENEHSLEVQLPFLQHVLGKKFLLVPIILGTIKTDTCKKIASILKPLFNPENLWIISTDFSHYPDYKDAVKVDELTANAICKNHPEKLQSVLNANKKLKIENLATSLCGWTSVTTLLYITKNEKFDFEKIVYQNSGDSILYGGKNRVVGYWSISMTRKNGTFKISGKEKSELLEKARSSITNYIKTGKKGDIIPPASNGILNRITGAFVSIYIKDKLRGCIGSFAKDKTLNELVQNVAVSASHDRRFDPIEPAELENMKLEISVLSPLKKIKSKSEIELGKHGIFIKNGYKTGTFLPQVAKKTNWTIDEFLGHCSRDKAGLGWNGWKNAELFTYEAIILNE